MKLLAFASFQSINFLSYEFDRYLNFYLNFGNLAGNKIHALDSST